MGRQISLRWNLPFRQRILRFQNCIKAMTHSRSGQSQPQCREPVNYSVEFMRCCGQSNYTRGALRMILRIPTALAGQC